MNFKRFHESKNLFDADAWYGAYKQADGTYQTNRNTWYSIVVKPFTNDDIGKSFCFAADVVPSSGNARFAAIINGVQINGQYIGNRCEVSFTVQTIDDRIIFDYGSGSTTITIVSNIMLNSGSTALPYEPYSSEVWHDTPHYIMETSTDTITTLPADLYPNDTTATVELKGNMEQNGTPTPTNPIQPSECGDRTANLFDGQLQQGYYTYHNGLYVLADAYVCTHLIPCTENTTYTFRCINTGGGSKNYGYVFFDSTQNRIGDDYINRSTEEDVVTHTATTPQNTAFLAINIAYGRRQANVIRPSDITDFMLNTGSNPLPYEPYGVKIPISSASTTTPVYFGEVQTRRKIKKLVLDGTEDWKLWAMSASSTTERFYINIVGVGEITCICSHFRYVEDNSDTIHFRFGGTNRNDLLFWIDKQVASTVADFKAYLQQQYAAGTPVTVWYILATPTTGIVNEPLRKIGDYADTVSGITIPTTAGANTLSVGTTVQPSEVTVNYKGWHPVQSVHERDSGAWT